MVVKKSSEGHRQRLRDKNRELFMVIYLNGRNQIIKMEEVFEGTLSTSAV